MKWLDFSTHTEFYVKDHDKTMCPLPVYSYSTQSILYTEVTAYITKWKVNQIFTMTGKDVRFLFAKSGRNSSWLVLSYSSPNYFIIPYYTYISSTFSRDEGIAIQHSKWFLYNICSF